MKQVIDERDELLLVEAVLKGYEPSMARNDALRAVRKLLNSITGEAQPAEQFCEDEGCPHHGTDHVCIEKPIEQAKEAMK